MSDLDLDLTPEPPVSAANVAEARQHRALVARIAGDRSGRYARSGKGASDAGDMPMKAPTSGVARVSPSPSTSALTSTSTSTSTGGIHDAARSLSEAFDSRGSVTCANAVQRALVLLQANAERSQGASIDRIQTNAETEARTAGGRVAATRLGRSADRSVVGALTSPVTSTSDMSSITSTASTAKSLSPSSPPSLPPSSSPLMFSDALVVPAGALARGYLRCRALLLAGDIVGNVHCTAGPVVIRAGASLAGRLVASGDVYVCGTVADSGGGAVISTRGKLTLAAGARVEGDVRSGRLDIHDGAMLAGVARACED